MMLRKSRAEPNLFELCRDVVKNVQWTLVSRKNTAQKGVVTEWEQPLFYECGVDKVITSQRVGDTRSQNELIENTYSLMGTSINHPEGVRLLITRYKPKAQCRDTQTSVNCVPTGRENGNK